MEFPDELRYTPEHQWVREQAGGLRVGITAFAQDGLGEVVEVSLPLVGAQVTAGQPVGEVESTTSVADLYAPATGRVTAVNEALESSPELVSDDPYGEGWLLDIAPTDGAEPGLLTAGEYERRVRRSPA